MQRRKRANPSRSLSRQVLSSLVHDARQPLTAMRLDMSTALQLVRERSPNDAICALEDALGELAKVEGYLLRLAAEVNDVAE